MNKSLKHALVDYPGIGLYMSKVIIEEHMNGYLDVRNIEDGAKFRITTPIVQSGL